MKTTQSMPTEESVTIHKEVHLLFQSDVVKWEKKSIKDEHAIHKYNKII